MRNLINLMEDQGVTDAWFRDGGFETYKKDLEVGILKIANENGFAEEVSQQINQAKQNSYKTF